MQSGIAGIRKRLQMLVGPVRQAFFSIGIQLRKQTESDSPCVAALSDTATALLTCRYIFGRIHLQCSLLQQRTTLKGDSKEGFGSFLDSLDKRAFDQPAGRLRQTDVSAEKDVRDVVFESCFQASLQGSSPLAVTVLRLNQPRLVQLYVAMGYPAGA